MRRRPVSPARLRKLLNAELQRQTGRDDVVFRGAIKRKRNGSRGCNWSAHGLTVPADWAAEADQVVRRVGARYNLEA
ncbi:MAG: hypothetical protein GWN99_15980 [Gemmatimonadetes bacterium]|uniref:Uncharacterized protein n=1 Tax=Candidatus Kutchimonas denitrificans TaxID=3056748 RepID=A0AAE4Z6J8_9BACT|nr:hypothetical protein [Gemmatimonadota bacterium]NIR74284.1 hypothetical protein [Candidatus Kutchimonas denitrificans]NIS02539.1 hypothetical protein [Gemmatimonadota bacterium]NIT68415.1 hypothetical protein [Gemmatimonadota bacterium]NIU51867.1 hypothetical protein [Gemmatimonadota bacterium]